MPHGSKNVAGWPKHESGSSFLVRFWRSSFGEAMLASGQGENDGDNDEVVNNNGYTVFNAHTYSVCQVGIMHYSVDCLTTVCEVGALLVPIL